MTILHVLGHKHVNQAKAALQSCAVNVTLAVFKAGQ
ncbi:hypothetical protein AAKU58_003394 [Oxalobacteraceae bacterium GrIS 1.18]